ncbi:MAG: protein kinase [Candidatus Krumholzibacteriia bacterium]
MGSRARLTSFDLAPGDLVAGKYVVQDLLGRGYEGEVYLVKERVTGVERSAKLFFPHRNERDRAVRHHARKLHRLRNCPVLIQYHTREIHRFGDVAVSVMVSEYVDGELLPAFLKRQPGGRLDVFQAMRLVRVLALGVEDIHALGEHHGDLHVGNVLVARRGLEFSVKLVDPFPPDSSRSAAEARLDDVWEMIRLLHHIAGGARRYASQPPEFKDVCCGLKRSLIARKFRTAGELRWYLENLEWTSR